MKYIKLLESIEFYENFYGFNSGQHDVTMYMYDNDNKVAYVDYSIYDNEISIKMIKSIIKGKGYSYRLIIHLAEKYNYENIHWGMLTEDGVLLKRKLDDYFNFNRDEYNEEKSKHIKPSKLEEIKNPIIKKFLIEYTHTSDEKIDAMFNKWFSNTIFRKIVDLDNININSIMDIANWVKDSPHNNNLLEDVPYDHVLDNLEQLIKYEDVTMLNIDY